MLKAVRLHLSDRQNEDALRWTSVTGEERVARTIGSSQDVHRHPDMSQDQNLKRLPTVALYMLRFLPLAQLLAIQTEQTVKHDYVCLLPGTLFLPSVRTPVVL